MKKITAFHYEGCPYCVRAFRAIDELIQENSKYADVQIEWILENEHMDIADQYDYYACPSMFIGKEKLYESHLFEKYEECRENIRRVFDIALSE
ncbi:MAG: glutaredoxin [Solobacterium sp.]|nr:glutaredoxin [Solobacterium sp.]